MVSFESSQSVYDYMHLHCMIACINLIKPFCTLLQGMVVLMAMVASAVVDRSITN